MSTIKPGDVMLTKSCRMVRVLASRDDGAVAMRDYRSRVAVRSVDTDRLSYHSEHELTHVQPPAKPQEPICGTCGKPSSDGDTYVQCGPCHWAETPSPEGQTWHEEWRGVVGYEGRYEVSCFGRVRKLGGPIVGQWRKSAGYYQVRLSEPRAVHLVHRLVAKAFIPNHENKPGVNHIDFDTINNAVANLEWCTQAENIQHSAKAGRMNRPEMRGKRPTVAAFTDEQVAAMRQQYATGGETWSSLAAKFGVSKRTVGRILRREVYSYV